MRKIIIIVLQVVSASLLADEAETIRQTNQLVEQVKNKMPENWDASCYVDNYLGWREIAEFEQLKKAVSGNWKEILENVRGIAPSEIHQIILFVSFGSLPLKDSFRCLDKIADLCLDNVISKEMFEWVRTIYEVHTTPTYRLAFHYEDPIVVNILRKAKTIQPEKAEHYDRVLRGKERRDLTIWFEESGESKPIYSDAVDGIGLAIVIAARSQIGRTVKYDSRYARLEYPMGDVSIETGVCTDVIIRALRDAIGMDLQQLIHQDMKASFLLYPKRWGLKLPDKSIDHRRVLNQKKYFERKGFSVPISDKAEDYLPGDIITCGLPHIMIVSDKKNEQGIPLVIHNIGQGTREESNLFFSDVTGHYRITHKGRQSILNNAIVLVSVTIIISAVMVAWRYFRKRKQG
jgi:uncharacterized protein YijF (DUF1287 family)